MNGKGMYEPEEPDALLRYLLLLRRDASATIFCHVHNFIEAVILAEGQGAAVSNRRQRDISFKMVTKESKGSRIFVASHSAAKNP